MVKKLALSNQICLSFEIKFINEFRYYNLILRISTQIQNKVKCFTNKNNMLEYVLFYFIIE